MAKIHGVKNLSRYVKILTICMSPESLNVD